jgi:transposase
VDETGIRIEGLNGSYWVFWSDQAIVHEAQLSRAAQVVRDVFLGDAVHRLPGGAWVSIALGSGFRMGIRRNKTTGTTTRPAWRIHCLAVDCTAINEKVARDVAYGVDASEDGLPFRLKLWLDRVFALAREVTTYAASTLERKRRALERSLAELEGTQSACPIAEELRGKMARASPKLLTFLDFPGDMDVTNNACERTLRPSVIQRKVTNGFRSMWAAQGDCAVRSVTDTAKLTGNSAWMTINQTLA